MVTEDYAINIFVNALQQNLEDVERTDIDDYNIGFRPSASYWIDYGWIEKRWKDHGLPQISIFQVGGRTEEESYDARREMMLLQVDILASGRNQKTNLTDQVKNALYTRIQRESMAKSGVKMDKLVSEVDTIEDEMLPQKVYRKLMTYKVYYQSSGA